jgi:LruC domain-containing protein
MLIAGAMLLTGLTLVDGAFSWTLLRWTGTSPNYTLVASPTYTDVGTPTGYYGTSEGRRGNSRAMNAGANRNASWNSFPGGYFGDATGLLAEGQAITARYADYNLPNSLPGVHVKNAGRVYIHWAYGELQTHSLGYYTWTDAQGAPTDKMAILERVIFPNTQSVTSTDTMYLGNFPANTNIGFVLVKNGWNGPPTSTTMSPVITDSAIANNCFFSVKSLNPESDPENLGLNQHAVMFWDSDTGARLAAGQVNIVVGMEATRRDGAYGSDHDFNDVMFVLSSDPVNALDKTGVYNRPVVNDTDGDGVPDISDKYPSDIDRAFDIDEQPGTLAFEDMWPLTGDYDLNDLILRYQVKRVEGVYEAYDFAQLVKDLEITVQVQARGANIRSGFGMELQGLLRSVYAENSDQALNATATLSINNATPVPITPEAGQTNLTYIFFEDAYPYTVADSGYKYFNTEAGQGKDGAPQFKIKVTFANPVDLVAMGLLAPYNPFIFRSAHREYEVHLVNKPPTNLADRALFRTGNDDSITGSGRYYVTADGHPWALKVPVSWSSHPLEEMNLPLAFPDFANWVSSGGTQSQAWYNSPADGKVYSYGN